MRKIPFIFMCLLLLVGCAGGKALKVDNTSLEIYEPVYRLEVINNSDHQAMTIMCVLNMLDDKKQCLTGAVPLYPADFHHANTDVIMPTTVHMNLKAGDYLFFINNMNLITGKTTKTKVPASVFEDGKLFLVPVE